jgi:hypothetical protein
MSRRSPPRSLSAPTEPLSHRVEVAGVEAAAVGAAQVEQAAAQPEQARVRAELARPAVRGRAPVEQDRPTALREGEGRRHPDPTVLGLPINAPLEGTVLGPAMTQPCAIQIRQAGSILHVEHASASGSVFAMTITRIGMAKTFQESAHDMPDGRPVARQKRGRLPKSAAPSTGSRQGTRLYVVRSFRTVGLAI